MSSEPYFYDQSYENGKNTLRSRIPVDGMLLNERFGFARNTPIPVDEQEKCAVAQEIGEEIPKPNSR